MRKKNVVTNNKTPKENAQIQLKRVQEEVVRAGEPTYSFEIGQQILCGSLDNCIVDEILDGGKVIGFTYVAHSGHEGSFDYKEFSAYRYAPWYNVRPVVENNTSFTRNQDLKINYMQQDISSLLTKHYSFGVNFNPDYQRESVWSDEDRELLLESIFMGADIGKFVFVQLDDYTWEITGNSYEILDGKQRLLTLIAYYENRFSYKGKYYNDLSSLDKYTFKRTMVSVGEIRDASKEKILRTFIMLNRGGKPVAEEIIDNAKKLLKEELEKNN